MGGLIPTTWAALINGRLGLINGNQSTYFVQQDGVGELSTYDYGTNQGMPLALNMNGGNVGVGTISPKAQFHVGPPAGANIPNNWTALVNGRFGFVLGDKSTYFVQQGGWGELSTFDYGTATGMPLALNMNGGNVGIATTAPAAKLDVNGGLKAASVQITGGTPGAGKVLTASDANGNASWQTPAGGGGTATDVNCAAPCISTAEIADASITTGKLAGLVEEFMARFNVDEETAIDLVGGVGRLVVVGVVLDPEVDERDLLGVERAVIRLIGPVLNTTGNGHRLVVAEEHANRCARGHLVQRSLEIRIVVRPGNEDLALVVAADHVEVHVQANPLLRDRRLDHERLRSEERRVGKECRSRWSPYH